MPGGYVSQVIEARKFLADGGGVARRHQFRVLVCVCVGKPGVFWTMSQLYTLDWVRGNATACCNTPSPLNELWCVHREPQGRLPKVLLQAWRETAANIGTAQWAKSKLWLSSSA